MQPIRRRRPPTRRQNRLPARCYRTLLLPIMATIWRVVAYLIPVPIALFVLLSLPLPRCEGPVHLARRRAPAALTRGRRHPPPCCRTVRQGIVLFTQRIFDLPLLGAFKLLHVMLFLNGVAFLGSMRQAHHVQQAQAEAVAFATPNMELAVLSKVCACCLECLNWPGAPAAAVFSRDRGGGGQRRG